MRPGQNKRMRGRNNNNNNGGHRRGPNPLTRSYESNGPDVKIRGTAQHIGEKYLQLARDAQTSGDPVAAENYLQHAEHYFRIIAAAHQAQQQAQVGYVRQPGEIEVDESDGDEDVVMPDRFALPSERFPTAAPAGAGQQPYADRAGFNGERVNGQTERGNGQERYERQERGENPYRAERQDRSDRDQRNDRPNADRSNAERQGAERQSGDRPNGERATYDRSNAGEDRDRQPRNDRPDRNAQRSRYSRDGQDFRSQRGDRDPQGGRDQRDTRDPQFREQPRVEAQPQPDVRVPQPEVEAGPDLPAFITAPVRVPPQASAPTMPDVETSVVTSAVDAAPLPESTDQASETFAVRPRRRRRTRAMIEAEAAAEAGGDPVAE